SRRVSGTIRHDASGARVLRYEEGPRHLAESGRRCAQRGNRVCARAQREGVIGMKLRWTVFTSNRTSMTIHITEGPAVPVTVVTLATTTRPFDEAGELYYLQVIRQFPSLLEGELMAARYKLY